MRTATRVTLAAMAVLLVGAGLTALVSAQRGASPSPSPSATPADCSAYEGHAKERCEAAQAQHRQERLRRHCADDPRDQVCQRAAQAARHNAWCAENPESERCR